MVQCVIVILGVSIKVADRIFLVLALTAFLTSLLTIKYCHSGKLCKPQAWLCGFEGDLDIETMKCKSSASRMVVYAGLHPEGRRPLVATQRESPRRMRGSKSYANKPSIRQDDLTFSLS